MPEPQPLPYTARNRKKSRYASILIGAVFLLTIVVFGILFGAGTLIHGS